MSQPQGSDAWITYHRADAAWVEALAQRLGDAGLTVFYEEWNERSASRPGSANVNVLVLSRRSIAEGWLSTAEQARARLSTSGGRLIELIVGEVELRYLLAGVPRVHFSGGGATDQRAFLLLLALIRMPATVSNLPAEPSGIPLRTAELDDLVGFFRANADGRPLAAIVGASGAGKTSLARYLAHRLRDHYPDGQLFCAVGNSSLSRVLRLLLDELGLPHSLLFSTLPELAEAYGVLTRGRRMLLVLDAVEALGELSGVLGPWPGSAVVLTAREVPVGIVPSLERAKIVELQPLTEAQALRLLESEVGAERMRAEGPAILGALRQLGGAPISIALLGRQMREHPELDPGAVLRELLPAEQQPAERLSQGLWLAYQGMPEADRILFRRMELLLEPEVEVGLGAALVDSSPDEATAALQRLVEAQLVEASGAGRYRVRELARELARTRLSEEEREPDRQGALRRALRWLAARARYQPDARIARDYWTADDTLGYGQYADAIAAFIRHEETRPPLTIGVKAPWGAGKTSLMRMVQERLDPPEDRRAWSPTRLRLRPRARASLSGDAGPLSVVTPKRGRSGPSPATAGRDAEAARTSVTILELLRRAARGPRAADADLEGLDVDPPATERLHQRRDWRPTVWFNPWMYQSGEQVWAGLAHEIINQVSGRLEPGDRERFWLELNLRRIDRQAVRRRIYRLLAERILPLAVGFGVTILVVAVMGIVAWLAPATRAVLRWPSVGLLSVGTVGGLLEALRRGVRFFREDAIGQFRPLVGQPDLAGGSKRLLEEQAKGSLDTLLRDPAYQGRLGFLYLVHTDMRRVLDLVATDRRPLVVFVDDLDRCSPSTVAQVIEAINLFLAGEFPNCLFVLAVEPAVVAAHVELAYKDLVDSSGRHGLAGRSSTLGWRFLEKIVQLPLSLPLPAGQGHLDQYVDSLLGTAEVAADLAGPLEGDRRSLPPPDAIERDGTAPAAGGDGTTDAAGQGAGTPAGLLPDDDAPLRMDLVRRIEHEIRRQSPTVDSLPEAARRAQDAVLAAPAGAVLIPETLEAANRVFVELYSDADSRDAILAAIPMLDSSSPREIKRFINLFRFYTFIAQQYRLRNEPAPDGPEIAKLAVLAIRWPHLLNALGSRLAGEGPPTALAHLEAQAREGEAQPDGWKGALAAAGLDGAEPDSPEHASSLELRRFLASGPAIAAASERLL
jgi:hypothetical protein